MRVGLLSFWQNFLDRYSDHEIVDTNLKLALLAEPLGLDFVGSVEHHFFNYSMCPDNLQFFSWLAGQTSRIEFIPTAIILPWNNPVRVAEKVVMLDHFSKGRAALGIGRGLSTREFAGFGIDMNESRERFDEAAEMILRAVETGFAEGEGPFYPQSRVELRPRPLRSFRDRFYCVALSPDSVITCARLGATLCSFILKPWEQLTGHFGSYRTQFEEHHNRPAPNPVCCLNVVCEESAELAEKLAYEHIGNTFASSLEHYDLSGDSLKNVKGYDDWLNNPEHAGNLRSSEDAGTFVEANIWGTPQQILDKVDHARQVIGDFDMAFQTYFGANSAEDAERSLRLFCQKVLPELKSA